MVGGRFDLVTRPKRGREAEGMVGGREETLLGMADERTEVGREDFSLLAGAADVLGMDLAAGRWAAAANGGSLTIGFTTDFGFSTA